jgi:cobalt-zinc-cadmium efflux system membrane fusion protein
MDPSPPSSDRPGPRSVGWTQRRQLTVLAIIAAGVIAVLAIGWLVQRAAGGRTDGAAAAAASPGSFTPTAQQLKSLTIEPVALHRFFSEERTEGKIAVNADRATPVYSPYSGRVLRVLAGLGDAVEQGQALASIDASEFAQARTDLRGATAQLALARSTEARRHGLYDIKGGSLADWQQAQADLAGAEANLAAVRNRLRILGFSDAAIDALGAAGPAQADTRADTSASILAPLRGVIVDRQIGPGQYAQAGTATPMFTIADLSSVWLVANVRESDAGQVHRGQRVEVSVFAYPGRRFEARVVYVAPTIDPATHRLPVRAVIDNTDGALKPEMFASFRILTSEGTQAPGVPEGAVVYEGEAAHVWVLQPDQSLVIRPIRAGRTSDGFVEVLEGLKPGERIVTRGSLFIDRAAAG